MKNTVYWLLHGELADYPESELWVNDRYPVCGNLTFDDNIRSIHNAMLRDTPVKYVIITDTTEPAEKESVRKSFISNNVIDISGGYDGGKIRKQIQWILSGFGKENDGGNVFFCSDTHFGHGNIIRYCNRPWNSGKDADGNLIITEDDIKRMDEEMIVNWNSAVGKTDLVWHLGDFALGPNQKERIPELVKRLNGRINLVMGNHDHHPVDFYYEAGFHRVYDRPVVIKDFCILSHAPMEFVKAPMFNCFGHVHDCETYKTWSKDSCCVCVERHGYRPVSFAEIKRHYDELNGGND